MKKRKETELDFEIDTLTNSIENVQSGDNFPTEVSLLTKTEAKNLTKKNGWRFNWISELKIPTREVYKLTITNNPNVIQGVVNGSKDRPCLYTFDKKCTVNIGRNKTYLGSGKSCCFCLQTIFSAWCRRICFISF